MAPTCSIETKEQWAGDSEGQDPHCRNHNKDSLPGAMGGIVQDGHYYGCVPAETHTHACVRTHRQ